MSRHGENGRPMKGSGLVEGARVFIKDSNHPWGSHAGELVAFEKYGLGWTGWRIKLDGNCGECYANSDQLARAA